MRTTETAPVLIMLVLAVFGPGGHKVGQYTWDAKSARQTPTALDGHEDR